MAPFFNTGSVDVQVPDKLELAKQAYFNQPDGFPFGDFRLEDVNLPPEDASAVEEDNDVDSVAQDGAASHETGYGSSIGKPWHVFVYIVLYCRLYPPTRSCCAAIDGLPVTTADKFEKLEAMVRRKFEAHGKIHEGVQQIPGCLANMHCVSERYRAAFPSNHAATDLC